MECRKGVRWPEAGSKSKSMLSLLGLGHPRKHTICLRACVVSCYALLLKFGQALSAALPAG